MKKKMGVIVGILFISLVSLGVTVLPDDTHYCQDRNITHHCDSLSKYYGLDNGKCIKDLGANKLCRSGWLEINDGVITVKSYQYLCNNKRCIVKE